MPKSRMIFGVAVAAVAFVAACGDTTPTPSASAAALASPTPPVATAPALPAPSAEAPSNAAPSAEAPSPSGPATPVADLSGPFLASMRDPSLRANVALTGTRTVGGTTTRTTGSLAIDARDYHLTRTDTTGKHSSKTDRIIDAGQRFVSDFGVWFRGVDNADDRLVAALRGLSTGVTDNGVVDRNGRQLHHLVIEPPDTLQAALTESNVHDLATTLEAWADDTGTPVEVAIRASWTQPSGKQTVKGSKTVDLAFSDVGSPVRVSRPPTVWQWSTSKRYHYRMAHPEAWAVDLATNGFVDGYYGLGGRGTYVERFSAHHNSLAQLNAQLKKNPDRLTTFKHVKVLSDKAGHLGPMPARVVEITGTYKGNRYWWVITFAVKNGNVYWLELRTNTKTVPEDRALAAQFARTFAPR